MAVQIERDFSVGGHAESFPMFRRILRSTIVLAAIIAAYQAYVLLAVPHMEPSLAIREQRIATENEVHDSKDSISKYQRLLANYFPKDHWSQRQPPKVFASGTEQVMLVIDDYTRRPVGNEKDDFTQVDINRLAIVMFPTPPHAEIVKRLATRSSSKRREVRSWCSMIFTRNWAASARLREVTFPALL